jgi:hypothetical protein
MSGLRYGVHVPSFADPGALVERGADLSGMAGTGCFVWDQILGALEPPMPIADPWMVLGAALGSAPSGSGWHGGHAAAPAAAQEAGQGASHRRPPLRRRMGRSMGPAARPTPSTRVRCARCHAVLAERLEWRPPVVGASGPAIAGATSAPTR